MTLPPSDLFASRILNELLYLAIDHLVCLEDDLEYLTAQIDSMNNRKKLLESRIDQSKKTKAAIGKMLNDKIIPSTEDTGT